MMDELNIFDKLSIDKRPGGDVAKGAANTLTQAYRAAQTLPQAVLKVSSYSHGAGRVGTHVKYISREADLVVEDPQGGQLKDPEEMKERIAEWAMDFDLRKGSRDTVNIILSVPIDSKLGDVERSVRDFAWITFGQTNDYLFALHSDTDHPHGHLMVKMRGYEGEKLNPGRKDLRDWRASFAQSLRENGVEVDASSRSSRGVGRKGSRQSVVHIRSRGEKSTVDREAEKDSVRDFHQKKNPKDMPWAIAAKEKTQAHKEELKRLAMAAKAAAKVSGNISLDTMANSIYEHAQKIPEPKTRAEDYHHQMQLQEKKN